MGLRDLARCPNVKLPDFTPRIVKSTTVACFPSPSKATIQRMGLTKRGASFCVQYMLLGNAMPKIAPGRISGRISTAGRPEVVFLKDRYSPFGVVVRVNSAVPTEFLCAKLSAARV